MEPKILSQTPVSMAELKLEIGAIKKREKEPSIRVTRVEDYLNSLSHLTAEKEKKLTDEIKKLEIPRLKEEHIIKIADMLPRTADDMKLLMQGYVISISNENIKKIVNAVNSVLEGK